MQCTSYYIGYLRYIIKAGCKDERSKVYYIFQLKVYSCTPACHTPWWLSATLCWPTSDRPHKRSHEVTDWPHQACVGAFDLSSSIVPSRPHWVKWVRSLIPRPIPSFSQSLGWGGLVNANTCLESAYALVLCPDSTPLRGVRGGVWPRGYICPVSTSLVTSRKNLRKVRLVKWGQILGLF